MQDAPPVSEHAAWQACLLAVVAGYADTVGFLKSGAFAGLMTGNTVLLGIALVRGHFTDAVHSASIIAMFLAGVAGAGLLLRRQAELPLLLAIEAALLIAAALAPYPFAAPTLAFAMGLQNAAATRFAGAVLNTVFLSGDLQKLVLALVPPAPGNAAAGSGVRVIASVWLSYLSGAALGAAAFGWTGHPMLLAPLLLPFAALRLRWQDRRSADAEATCRPSRPRP